MTELGHEVIHYGNEGSEVVCAEHVPILTKQDLETAYGQRDWGKEFFEYHRDDHAYQEFAKRVIPEIKQRAGPNEFLLCFFGWYQQPIATGLMDTQLITVEPGVGYPETFSRYRVFESYAKLSQEKGREDTNHRPDWTDAVIPNYFDLDDFEYQEEKDDCFFFIGRKTQVKGVEIVMELAKQTQTKVIIGGQGRLGELSPEHAEFVEEIGLVDKELRKKLYARVKALLMPSFYSESFGGVNVEAGLSGTPVITTDWGAMSETVIHGKTGFRCRSFEQMIWAAKNIDQIKPADCRAWAEQYSLERVSLMYHEYFTNIKRHIEAGVSVSPNWQDWENDRQAPMNVRGNFFYLNPEREDLDWLVREYPKAMIETKREKIMSEIAAITANTTVQNDGDGQETDVWDYLINEIKIPSILNIGAGEGHTALYLANKGIYVLAYDNVLETIKKAVYPVIYHDFQNKPFQVGLKFGLGYLFECLNHLPASAQPHLAETLNSLNSLFFTASAPPMPNGEINHQPLQYWVDFFQQHGFSVEENITSRIKELAKSPEMRDFSVFMTASF